MATEGMAHVLVRFEAGARGSLVVSQVSAGRKNSLRFQLDGSRGALGWDSERNEGLWRGSRGRPNETLLRDPALFAPEAAPRTTLPAGHAGGFAETFKELYRAASRGGGEGKEKDRECRSHPRSSRALTLEEVAEWAAGEGFQALEIACWPSGGGERRRYAGVTHIDVESFDPDGVHDVLDRHGLVVSSLAYYP